MAGRSYRQFCAIASALDTIGERWTLLIIRELLTGPKRYSDLLDGLPGIPTDMLAARLRRLEDEGLVEREVLPPPAASKVYVLTGSGLSLEPVIAALARWGTTRLKTVLVTIGVMSDMAPSRRPTPIKRGRSPRAERATKRRMSRPDSASAGSGR